MTRKALLVGINRYPGCPLSGCVNDTANMANLLMQNYGFKAEEICLLRDEEATTANILDKLNWLTNVQSGDEIVFHYSGHGATNAENGHLFSVICPVDFDWSLVHMITDKQFVEIFSRIPSGVAFYWVSDSCHAGDLFRDMPAPPKSFWSKLCFWRKDPPKMVSRAYPTPITTQAEINVVKQRGVRARGMVGGVLDVGFVAGCRLDQTSADTYVDGQSCGALTCYFLKNLRKMPNAPLSDVVSITQTQLAQDGYSQTPLAEGARANKMFLGF